MTIVDAVDVVAAVTAIVQACDLVDVQYTTVEVLAILTAVDNTGKSFTFCKAEGGKVSAKNS